MTVERFNLWHEPGEPAEMEPDEAGRYIRYSDYEKLRAELEAAREAIKWLHLLCRHYEQGVVATTGDPRPDGKIVVYGKDITDAVRAAVEGER